MCTTINNLEHVYKHFEPIGTELCLYTAANDSQERYEVNESSEILCQTLEYIDASIYRVLSKIPLQLESGLQRHVFHLAWSPDTLPIEEAINPLLDFLTKHLDKLNQKLLAGNFRRVMMVLWGSILDQLKIHTDKSAGERMPLFYDRLHDGLQILGEYFLCEGSGLEPRDIFSQTYRHVDLVFGYAKLSTDQLISEYYKERLTDQFNMGVAEFGVLLVRVYFRHDNLGIEIISARDVIPLDPNGLSDPFVIIELIPKNVFPKTSKQQTAVQRATLNPTFDETFEFNISREQCREAGAMISFTLMDWDVLTADDFGGEAFIALSCVPGVEQGSSTVENFHGLKPIHLPLMFQKNKDHPILGTLEGRKGDRIAQEFVKKQKMRMQE